MIKIALATDSLIELNDVKDALAKHYDIESTTEEKAGVQFVSVLTINAMPAMEIEEMLGLLEAITGIDPRKNDGKKGKIKVHVRRAASCLLRYRFGLSYRKIARILNYASHATPDISCRQFPEGAAFVDRRVVPIELAIRRVMLNVKMKGQRNE